MEKVVVKSSVGNKKTDELIYQMYKVCKTNSNLSPRSIKELMSAYKKGNILIAVKEADIAGWLVRIPYTKEFQELSAIYVRASYRSRGISQKLIQEAVRHRAKSCIVTFNYPFARHLLINHEGFSRSSLLEAIKLSRGKFLLNRLSAKRLLAIKQHYNVSKPIYILYSNL